MFPGALTFLVEPPQAAANRFSRNTKHESRNTAFFRPGLRSMKIMVREMSLIRGLGAPAKEMSFPHLLALFKDLSCPLLPTIARHCPLLPAKKMSQAVVASQYGRRSRGPGRVPRAAPRQPGCTVEPTNHEPRSFLARGASRREFRGFHETRITAFFRPGCARPAQPETAARTTAHAARSLLRCAPFARHGAAMARHGRHIAPEPASPLPSDVLGRPHGERRGLRNHGIVYRIPFAVGKTTGAIRPAPVAFRAASARANAK